MKNLSYDKIVIMYLSKLISHKILMTENHFISTLCPVPLLYFKFAQVEFFMILKQGWILSAYLSHFHGKKVVKLFPSLFNFFSCSNFPSNRFSFLHDRNFTKEIEKKNFSSCLSITRIIKRGSHRVSLSKSFSKKSHTVSKIKKKSFISHIFLNS